MSKIYINLKVQTKIGSQFALGKEEGVRKYLVQTMNVY